MTRIRYTIYRMVWAGVASLAVTTVLFVIARVAPDLGEYDGGELGPPLPGADIDNEFWDPADPVYLQYLDWVESLLTFDWGRSLRFGDSVGELIVERVVITAAYLVPAVIFGVVLATCLGYVAAAKQGQWSDGLIRGVSYLVLAVPNFIIGAVIYRFIHRRQHEFDADFYEIGAGLTGEWNLFWLAAAALILGTHVAAAQLRYVRAQSSEQLSAMYIKTLRANGQGRLGVARNVLRAAAVPLTSLFVAEVLGLLIVSVFIIEAVLSIPGIGSVVWKAAAVNDGPVVLVTVWLVALGVIFANLLEDILAVVLDPRIELR